MLNSDKQILIGKTILDYEMNFFEENLANRDVKLLHDVYLILIKNYNWLLNRYTSNNFILLKKDLNNDNEKLYWNSLFILMFIYFGIDKVVSFTFSQLLSLMKYNDVMNSKTNITMNLANLFINKILRLNVKTINKDIYSILSKIKSLDQLKDEIKNINDIPSFWLGDTIINIILQNSKIFEENIFNMNNISTVLIKIKKEYVHEILFNQINIAQLPMIDQPRTFYPNDWFFPIDFLKHLYLKLKMVQYLKRNSIKNIELKLRENSINVLIIIIRWNLKLIKLC